MIIGSVNYGSWRIIIKLNTAILFTLPKQNYDISIRTVRSALFHVSL